MKKRILALLMATVLVVSLVACGEKATSTPEPTATTAPTPTAEPTKAPVSAVEGGAASIDFEDGQAGFLAVYRPTELSDKSDAQIIDLDGSKVLYAENTMKKPETHIGIDLDALLGDKITSVKTIKFDLGSKADKFYAISGKVYLYSGEENAVKTATDFSVYMEKKNPKTVTVEVKNAFVAGQGNYIDIAKLSDSVYEEAKRAGKVAEVGVGLIVDNIKFLDASGKLIDVDKSAVVSENAAFMQSTGGEEVFEYGSSVMLMPGQPDDWTTNYVVPANFFEGVTGNIQLALDVEFADKPDYVVFKMTGSDWTEIPYDCFVGMETSKDAPFYFHQDDNGIVVCDFSLNKMYITITAEGAKVLAEHGGLAFPGHNLTVKKVTVSDDTFVAYKDPAQPDDWTTTNPVPGVFFEGATGNVQVELDIECADKPDYVVFKVTGADWTEVAYDDIIAIDTSKDAPFYFHQDDNGIVICDFSLNKIYLTFTANGAKTIAEHGGLCFPGHNITVKKATVRNEVFSALKDPAQPDDWTTTNPVPGAFFEGVEEDIQLILDIECADKPDYVVFKVTGADWTEVPYEAFKGVSTSKDAPFYFHQDDNGFVVTDFSISKMFITITKEGAKTIAEHGGLCFPGHNITVKKVTVAKNRFATYKDPAQPDDWTTTNPVPAEFFEGVTGNVTLALTIECADKPDYVVFKATGADWTEIPYDSVVGMATSKDDPFYFHQDDNGFVICDFSLTKMYITITAEGAKTIAEHGGLCFPGHNITVKEVVVIK